VVLRVTGETPEHGRELADVEGKVRGLLAEQRADEVVEALVRKLRAEVPQTRALELLERVKLDEQPPLDIPAGHPAAPPDPTAPTIIVEPDDA
jgi:hypothetical protein